MEWKKIIFYFALQLLALLNNFQHFDYATEYKYPTLDLNQMKGLLAKYKNLYPENCQLFAHVASGSSEVRDLHQFGDQKRL